MLNDENLTPQFRHVDVSSIQVQLIDILCPILLVLGLVGNMLGLFIFSSSRRTRRISSIYVFLATCSSIVNLLCVIRYASILHSRSRRILNELIGRSWWACKMYEFSFSFRLISSWVVLFWTFERLTRISASLPALLKRWNLVKLKFVIPTVILIGILGGVLGPPVYMFQPQILSIKLSNSTVNITQHYCRPNLKASPKWQRYFTETHLGRNYFTIRCLFSELFPTGAIILFNSYIICHLTRTYRHLHRTHTDKSTWEHRQTALWMNIVLIIHSSLFLCSLLCHIVGHFLAVEAHDVWWVLLAVLVNCSLNFYVYCLSGKAFRHEIHRFLHRYTMQLFSKLQTRHQRRQQRRKNYKNKGLIYEVKNVPDIDQFKTCLPTTYRISTHVNGPLEIGRKELVEIVS